MGFIGFYLNVIGFTEFLWVLLGLNGLKLNVISFTGLKWVLLGFDGFDWVSLEHY